MARKPTAGDGDPTTRDDTKVAADTPPPASGEIKPPAGVKDRIIDATMELAGERSFDDFGIAEIAERAGVSLGEFRDSFPSKGAVIGAFNRKIDRIVLDGTGTDLADDGPKDRLFDVLMRRFDAMVPYRLGIEGVRDWARREPMAAAALNRELVNSMRFMLVAAGIDVEGPVGALKTQGLALAFARMLDKWLRDEDPGFAQTMAALDKELNRGERIVARAEDLHRLTSPLRSLARAVFDSRRTMRDRVREGWGRRRRPYERDERDTDRGARQDAI